ncbi:hypothetical protein ACDQ55_00870 [Chitinophaga sp. 30R24]|uniref:hypothetical protein n=1 Tax=Chitinophaga sp. 30R24 TaxID=3248838 RepID=UPI003B90E34C
MLSPIQSLLLVVTGAMLLHACKKTADAPPLPENRVLQFTVTNVADGPVQGVINDKDTSITLYIPYYTALLSLLPVIEVPAGAIVTPASNTLLENWLVKQAMDTPMIYTVKAKNGSIANYHLHINGQQPDITVSEFSANAENPVVVTHKSKSESVSMGIKGDNLVPNEKINFVTLVNQAGKGYVLPAKAIYPMTYKNFSVAIPPDTMDLPSGKYQIRVTCFSQTVKLKNPVIIQQIP